jgi:hypothetical protein
MMNKHRITSKILVGVYVCIGGRSIDLFARAENVLGLFIGVSVPVLCRANDWIDKSGRVESRFQASKIGSKSMIFTKNQVCTHTQVNTENTTRLLQKYNRQPGRPSRGKYIFHSLFNSVNLLIFNFFRYRYLYRLLPVCSHK